MFLGVKKDDDGMIGLLLHGNYETDEDDKYMSFSLSKDNTLGMDLGYFCAEGVDDAYQFYRVDDKETGNFTKVKTTNDA